jgi:hypothetical protein
MFFRARTGARWRVRGHMQSHTHHARVFGLRIHCGGSRCARRVLLGLTVEHSIWSADQGRLRATIKGNIQFLSNEQAKLNPIGSPWFATSLVADTQQETGRCSRSSNTRTTCSAGLSRVVGRRGRSFQWPSRVTLSRQGTTGHCLLTRKSRRASAA